MRLENWAVVSKRFDPYAAPELRRRQVRGEVFQSKKFPDGSVITTSDVVAFKAGKVITANSEYELGDINPDYLAKHPEAVKLKGK